MFNIKIIEKHLAESTTNAGPCTGLDYTGCIYICPSNIVSEVQTYILLFTCAATRHIHLELCPDMTTNSFILAFRKFCARCSCPQYLISDQAATFHAGDNYLQSLFKSADVNDKLSSVNCKWIFNTERAPNFGGFFERLIGLTK